MRESALLPLLLVWVAWMFFPLSGQVVATLFAAAVALAAAAILSGRRRSA